VVFLIRKTAILIEEDLVTIEITEFVFQSAARIPVVFARLENHGNPSFYRCMSLESNSCAILETGELRIKEGNFLPSGRVRTRSGEDCGQRMYNFEQHLSDSKESFLKKGFGSRSFFLVFPGSGV